MTATVTTLKTAKPKPLRRGESYFDPYDESKTPLPRVTDVMGIVGKPGLEVWKQRQVFDAATRNPELTWEACRMEAFHISDDAKNRGSSVHTLLEALVLNGEEAIDWEDIHPTLRPQAEALRDYWRNQEPELVYSETTIISHTYGYAGTADLIVREHSGRTVLIDLKTSKSVYPEYAWQLSAYKHGDFLLVVHPANGLEKLKADIPAIDAMEVLHVPKDQGGTYSIVGMPDRFDDFLAALHLFNATRERACKPACPSCKGVRA